MPRIHSRTLSLITAISIALLAALLGSITARYATTQLATRILGLFSARSPTTPTTHTTTYPPYLGAMSSQPASPEQATAPSGATSNGTGTTRPPVYFISHGGPSTMYDTTHAVYPQLRAIGKEILEEVKPRGIVVFSAHWQSDVVDGVEVSVPEDEGQVEIARGGGGLLYDFYGFPRSYYAEKFSHTLSPTFSTHILTHLQKSSIRAHRTSRPLDHGVFVPFKIMFPSGLANTSTPIPLATVSLLADASDAAGHIALGKAVEGLRDEGICVVVSGMAVHNLGDFMRGRRGLSKNGGLPYAETFDEALREAVEAKPGEERDGKMVALLGRGDARRAHPSWEHLIPVHVGVGAAGGDWGVRRWTMVEGAMGWAQVRFG